MFRRFQLQYPFDEQYLGYDLYECLEAAIALLNQVRDEKGSLLRKHIVFGILSLHTLTTQEENLETALDLVKQIEDPTEYVNALIAILSMVITGDKAKESLASIYDAIAAIPSTYQWIGIDNYKTIVTSPELKSVAWFTVLWAFVNVFFHFTIGLGLALALTRTLMFRGWYRMLLLIPWAVPSFISAFSWRFIFNSPYGFLAQLFQKLGVPVEDIPAFLGDPTWAKVSVITANVWLGVPFMMVALLGGLQAIEAELYDAAAVDGASAWQRFWAVTMPGLRPVAATVILLGLIWTFNMFNVIYLITGGGPGTSTQIFATFAYQWAFVYKDYVVLHVDWVMSPYFFTTNETKYTKEFLTETLTQFAPHEARLACGSIIPTSSGCCRRAS